MRRSPVPVGLFAAVLIALVALVAVPAAGAWTWPSNGAVLQPFSFDPAHPYAAGQHRGIDVGGAADAPVVAPAAGTITFAGAVPGSGRTVTITTPDGLAITLTHLGSLTVAVGAAVAEGGGVGTIGPSGEPELQEPYVHLGIRLAANAQGYLDPLSLLPARPAPLTPPSAPTPPPGPAAPSPAAVLVAPATAPPATAPAAPAPPATPAAPVAAPAEATAAGAVAPPAPAAAPRGGDAPAASFLIVQRRPRGRVPDPSASGSIPRSAPASAIPSPAGSSRTVSSRTVSSRTVSSRTVSNRTALSPLERHVAAAAAAGGAERSAVQRRPVAEAQLDARPRQRPGSSLGGEARRRSYGASHPIWLRGHVPASAAPTAPARAVRSAAEARLRWSTVGPLLALLGLLGGLVAAVVGAARLRADRERVRMMARSGSGSEDPGSACLALRSGASSPGARGGLRRPVGRFRALSPPQGQRRSHGQRDGRARDAGDGRRRSRGEAIR